MVWCLGVYVVLPSFAKANVVFNYVTWFAILFVIASYIRLYPKAWFNSSKTTGILAVVSLILSWINKNDKVILFLGDLDEIDKDDRAVLWLKSYNIPSDHCIVDTELYQAQLNCVFSEPIIEKRIISLRNLFYQRVKIYMG